MELICAGAARTVTGSCHHLTLGGRRLLIDCGAYQGGAALEERNRRPFPFDLDALDAVLVTHGHFDHVGRLPRLVRLGYRGPIYATRATREIAEVILRDAARLQAEDHAREERRRRRNGRGGEVPEPLFDEDDVERALSLFAAPVEFGAPLALGGGVQARFGPAGHILGSAWIAVDGDGGRIVFSGDLGNRESPLHAPAVPPPACDVVLVETTYADRTHRSGAATRAEFRSVLREAIRRGGKVLIPSFALERSQVVLYALGRLVDEGLLDGRPVYLDSPMAAAMTELYRSCANAFRPEVKAALEGGDDPFDFPGLSFTVSTDASKAINEVSGGAVVIAGSGMMTGGRILHHLRHHLWRPETSLVIVGYQARGTLGRAIIDGAPKVRVFGEEVAVRAEVHTIGGFSAHADHDDLRAWLVASGDARVVLVHGEPEVMDGFAAELESDGRRVLAPEPDRPYPL